APLAETEEALIRGEEPADAERRDVGGRPVLETGGDRGDTPPIPDHAGGDPACSPIRPLYDPHHPPPRPAGRNRAHPAHPPARARRETRPSPRAPPSARRLRSTRRLDPRRRRRAATGRA